MPINSESKLANDSELLIRQVHPRMMSRGRPSSQIFRPTEADAGLLSADRNARVSAKDAYERYLANKKLEEAGGSWAISVGEVAEVGLIAYADPLITNDAHALIDFSPAGKDRENGISKLLFAKTVIRGRLYPLDRDTPSTLSPEPF